jgi:hypothetical protein
MAQTELNIDTQALSSEDIRDRELSLIQENTSAVYEFEYLRFGPIDNRRTSLLARTSLPSRAQFWSHPGSRAFWRQHGPDGYFDQVRLTGLYEGSLARS